MVGEANILENIHIVLVETSHGGNIGAVARAMKTMELSRLVLVNPTGFPSAECTARACGADDLLANARVYGDLDTALQDYQLVIGSSARQRTVAWPELDPRQTAPRLLTAASHGPVALLFGRESSGLTNTELDRCQALACIPTNTQFSSLNIAAAVQVFAYEIHTTYLATNADARPNPHRDVHNPAPMSELEAMFAHLATTLNAIDYGNARQSKKLLRRLRRLLYRTQPDRNEINMLRGMFSTTQRIAKQASVVNSSISPPLA